MLFLLPAATWCLLLQKLYSPKRGDCFVWMGSLLVKCSICLPQEFNGGSHGHIRSSWFFMVFLQKHLGGVMWQLQKILDPQSGHQSILRKSSQRLPSMNKGILIYDIKTYAIYVTTFRCFGNRKKTFPAVSSYVWCVFSIIAKGKWPIWRYLSQIMGLAWFSQMPCTQHCCYSRIEMKTISGMTWPIVGQMLHNMAATWQSKHSSDCSHSSCTQMSKREKPWPGSTLCTDESPIVHQIHQYIRLWFMVVICVVKAINHSGMSHPDPYVFELLSTSLLL